MLASATPAAAVMVRRTLEAVCEDQGAAGDDLYKRIENRGFASVPMRSRHAREAVCCVQRKRSRRPASARVQADWRTNWRIGTADRLAHQLDRQRAYELALQLVERPTPIHEIATDPDRRRNGEWF